MPIGPLLTTGRLIAARAGGGTFLLSGTTPVLSFGNWFAGLTSVYFGGYAGGSGLTVPGGQPIVQVDLQSTVLGNGSLCTTGSVSFCGIAASAWTVAGTQGPSPGSGTWSYQFDAEELVQYSNSLSTRPYSPADGGEVCNPYQILFSGYRPKLGGSYIVSVQIGSSTLTVGGTITAPMAAFVVGCPSTAANQSGHKANLGVRIGGKDTTGGPTMNVSITGTMDGVPLGYPYVYNSGPQNGETLNVNFTSGINATIYGVFPFYGSGYSTTNTGGTSSGQSCNDAPRSASISIADGGSALTQYLSTAFDIEGKVITTPPGIETKTLKANAYPTTISSTGIYAPISIFTFSPNAHSTGHFGQGVEIDLSGIVYHPPPSQIQEFPIQAVKIDALPGIHAILDTTDPTTAAECSISPSGSFPTNFDSRLLFRLPSVAGPFLAQSTRIVLDPCNSLTSPGAWTGVTVSGGHLQVTTGSSTVASVTYSPTLTSSQARYLAISINPPSSNEPITVTIQMQKGPVTYTTQTGASGIASDVVIDLCGCPGHPGPDLQFSMYDYPNPPEGPTWGANFIQSVSITFPLATGNYLIEQIALVSKFAPIISTQCGDKGYLLNSTSPSFTIGVAVDTDGRRSLEQPAASTAGTGLYTYYQVSDLLSGLHTGFSGSYVGGPEWYRPNPPDLCYLGGGGATWDGATSQSWTRNAWVQGSNIPIQGSVDAVMGYPNMGDLLGNGSGSGSLVLRVYKILRGTFHGVVFSNLFAPVSASPVTSKEGSLVTGTGTTDSIGRFSLGAPGSLNTGDVIATNNQTVTETVFIREDRRLGLAASSSVRTWIHEDDLGQLHVASVTAGDVTYQRSDQTTPIGGWATSGVVTSFGDVTFASMGIDPQLKRIHLLVTRFSAGSYSLYWLYSDSDGSDFTTGTLLMAGALGGTVWCQNISSIGFTWFQYDSGVSGPGKQYAQFSEGSGQPFSAPYIFSDASNNPIELADQGWGNVEEAKDFQNALIWSPTLSGHSTPTIMKSTDNGVTWGSV